MNSVQSMFPSFSCTIIIFARAPQAGKAKTRLIPLLGAAGAAQLQARMTRHALAVASAAQSRPGALVLCAAPDAANPELAAMARAHGAELAAQSGGDLGARMQAAFETWGYPALLMGSDAPCIDGADLRACAKALHEGADAVFLPAEDGGYGLVGLARPAPEIFSDMVWSTDKVMVQTRERLRTAKRIWREPRIIWDVDNPDDFKRLVASGFDTSGLAVDGLD